MISAAADYKKSDICIKKRKIFFIIGMKSAFQLVWRPIFI